MFSTLKPTSPFWDLTFCRGKWMEQAASRALGLTLSEVYVPGRRPCYDESSGIGMSFGGLHGSIGWSTLGGVRTGFVDRGSRILQATVRVVGESLERGGLESSRSVRSSIHLSNARPQASYGWKRRQRKGEYEAFLKGWNCYGETIFHETSQRNRICTAGSQCPPSVDMPASAGIIRKGALLEFQRESGQIVLAVAQNRDNKKNWIVLDQIGNTHCIRPQQITFVVPSPEDFQPSDISSFLVKVEKLQDVSLLEFAWEEVLAEKVIPPESLAKILYSRDTAVECYSVHRMLSGNQVYFRCKQQGLTSVYEPRPLSLVRELQQRRLADERAHELLLSYVKAVRQALRCPQTAKPAASSWQEVFHFHIRTEALKAYALGHQKTPAQKKSAEEVLDAMGLTKTSLAAVNLLIGMGIFPLHVNIDLLKMNDFLEFSAEHVAAVEQLQFIPPVDPDVRSRVDLTGMKVYTIDSDDTDEIDDGLSATRLPDGRLKVWIHVADPTRWVPHDHILYRAAEARGTSIYLPTGTIPMFPMELASGQMSLQRGHSCCAVTVSVVLLEDGSIAEYSVMNSTIRPTYKLSYENVEELLSMNVEEESELYLLAQAAACRAKLRKSQGAIFTNAPEAEIKVTDPDSPEPTIVLEVKDQSVPAMQLVAEMMILCGEAVALIGEKNGLSLPYRGQVRTDIPKRTLSLPEGPCRAFALRRLLGSADMSFTRPIAHASLGLSGYVQFTSPIRRFSDLLAHYQVKAYLRGNVPPFTCASLEAKMGIANVRMKDAKRLQISSLRYWTTEYLRTQPKERVYPAVVLRYLKDREASVLLLEVGIRCSVVLTSSPPIGSEVTVAVHCADPRKEILVIRQSQN